MKIRAPRWIDWEQSLKTGVAALISMLIYQGLHLQHGYWAVISAIIVMQTNLGSSIRAGGDRLIGTAIGALLGTIVFRYLGSSPLTVGLGVAVTIFVCSWLGLKASFRLAGVTTSIVLLIAEASPWQTGFNRFLDVALGVIVAVAVSAIWPSRARKDLQKSLAKTFEECDHLLALAMLCLRSDCETEKVEQNKSVLRDLGFRNRNLLADASREPGDQALARVSALIVDVAQRTTDHLFGMDYSARAMMQDRFHQSMEEPLEAVARELSVSLRKISTAILGGKMQIDLSPLQSALDLFEEEFATRRSRGESLQFDKDELLRFYAFLYRLRETAGEAKRAADLIHQRDRNGNAEAIENV